MKVSIGQDSHRFDEVRGAEGCLLGGVRFAGAAAEVDALREKDRVRQAEGLAALVRRWKSEYQRSQG